MYCVHDARERKIASERYANCEPANFDPWIQLAQIEYFLFQTFISPANGGGDCNQPSY